MSRCPLSLTSLVTVASADSSIHYAGYRHMAFTCAIALPWYGLPFPPVLLSFPLPLESNSNIPSLNAPSWYPDWVKSPPHRPSWNPVFLLHCPVAVAHTQGAQWSDYPLLKCNIYSDRNSSLFTMVTPGAAHRQHSTSVRSVSTSIPQILLRAPAALSDQKHTTWPSFPNILSHN